MHHYVAVGRASGYRPLPDDGQAGWDAAQGDAATAPLPSIAERAREVVWLEQAQPQSNGAEVSLGDSFSRLLPTKLAAPFTRRSATDAVRAYRLRDVILDASRMALSIGFIFMATRDDVTLSDARAYIEAALALGVGLALALGGALGLGFIADLLSIPVTTGFLAGIAGHILVSQAPALLGVAPPSGPLVAQVVALVAGVGATNLPTLALGLLVLALMLIGERLSPRFPGALLGLALAAIAVVAFGLERRGVATLGALSVAAPRLGWPDVGLADLPQLAPLAIIVALVVMVQTAATTRGFVSDPAVGPDVGCDFIGLGAANLLSGFLGAFPLNASPPRTAVVSETGGVSQFGALICAGLALALAAFGGGLLAHVPHAALAGVLLFIAQRIFRVGTMIDVWRRSSAEFALVVATMLALLVLPIQQGVALGVILSLLHGVWTTTRAGLVEFERIPGTSIWWPASALQRSERAPGVRVLGMQAPLSFLNAYAIQSEIEAYRAADVRLLVIEANAVVEIDYTGATVLAALVRRLRAGGVDVAFARLESLRAQRSFARQGLEALVGRDHLFHSVEEAVQTLQAGKRG